MKILHALALLFALLVPAIGCEQGKKIETPTGSFAAPKPSDITGSGAGGADKP
jgi:hypothetical protein